MLKNELLSNPSAMLCWYHNCRKRLVLIPGYHLVLLCGSSCRNLVPPNFIVGSRCTKGIQLLDYFFSRASSPNAICNIEGCDVTAVVIIFPIEPAQKVLLSEGETFNSSNSKISLQLCHIETSSSCGYSSLTFGSFMVSFFNFNCNLINLYVIFVTVTVDQLKQI